MSDVVDALTERMAAAQAELRERGQPARHARMREHVLERVAEPRGSAGPRWWAWSMAVGAVAAAVLLVWIAVRPQALTFQVEGATDSGQAQAFVAAGEDQPLTLAFSDGSAVELRPRTRVRVGALRDDGADLVLESGTLRASIEPLAAGSWSVAAGPYRVDVIGTVFSVRWVPEEESFELELSRGAVQVQGPGIEGVREVAVGERLVIMGRNERAEASEPAARVDEAGEQSEEIVIDEAEPGVEAEPRTGARRGSGGKPSRSGSGSGSDGEAVGTGVEDWRKLAHQGSYREALAAAEAAGFSQLCASLDAAALLELADAGRYARKIARAREALVALRRRFPGTEAAAAAAFDLGRLGSGGANECGDATKWFRTYLRERPQGSMADAARHRIDECAEGSAEEAGSAP
jgi:transmembrane sensor